MVECDSGDGMYEYNYENNKIMEYVYRYTNTKKMNIESQNMRQITGLNTNAHKDTGNRDTNIAI